MNKKQKRKSNETYPAWVRRLFPSLSDKEQVLIAEMMKEAWFDGLRFERKFNKQ